MKCMLALIIFGICLQQGIGQTNVYPSTGNVGLGTASPSHLLTLDLGNTRNGINIKSDGDLGAYSDLMFEMKTTTNVPAGKPTMWMFSSRKDGFFSNDISGNTLEMYATKKGGGYLAPLLFKSNGDLVLAGARNATNGFVGVGVSNPRALLDVGRFVSGGTTASVLARLEQGDAQGTFLGVKGWETALPGYGAVYGGKAFSIDHIFYGQLNSAINFYRGGSLTGGFMTFATNNGTEQMRINYNGNVGIGTANPNEKLSVNGNIRAKEIKVEQSNWPDYVFKSSYTLMPLQKVEAFIKANGYLPEMPSAKEVEAKGIEVGANQALLLKKIEELTLYMIGLKKENEGLKKEMADLKNAFIKK